MTESSDVMIQLGLVGLAFQLVSLGLNVLVLAFTNLLTQVYAQFFGFFENLLM